MLYFFLSLSELKKTFGGRICQRKPFVTFCNFLFPNCTPGLYIKSIADFSRFAYRRQFTHPRQIAQNHPLQTLIFCAILTLANCGIIAIIISVKGNTKAPNTSHKGPPKKIKNFSKKGLTTKTSCGIIQTFHRDTERKPEAEYLRRRKLNKPPESVDHVRNGITVDWGI